jgi:hypothetical protein
MTTLAKGEALLARSSPPEVIKGLRKIGAMTPRLWKVGPPGGK